MNLYVTDLRHFSGWLAQHAPEVLAPAMVSRTVLEDCMLWVRLRPDWRQATRQRRPVALRALLEEQAEDGLAGLPRSAMIHRRELRRVEYRLSKELPDEVFAQWVDPGNLALLGSELHRTVVMLLAYNAFRVSSVVTLQRDARVIGSDGQPYLRYWNIKAKRQAALLISPALSGQLERHETFLRDRYPEGSDWLLPSPPIGEQHNGRGGGFHISHCTVQKIVKHYIREAEIRTADGQLALHVHPHLFRHHLAVLERITYANEETGYTVARVATERTGPDLLTVRPAPIGPARDAPRKAPTSSPAAHPAVELELANTAAGYRELFSQPGDLQPLALVLLLGDRADDGRADGGAFRHRDPEHHRRAAQPVDRGAWSGTETDQADRPGVERAEAGQGSDGVPVRRRGLDLAGGADLQALSRGVDLASAHRALPAGLGGVGDRLQDRRHDRQGRRDPARQPRAD
jgi:integrase